MAFNYLIPNSVKILMVIEGRRVGDGGSGVGDWRGDLSYGSGVCDGRSVFGDGCGGVCDGSSDLHGEGLFAYDSVETVVRISGVIHGTLGAISIDERVRTVHYISITSFMLALGVTGVSVLNVIGEGVLWVRVVSFHDLGDWSDCCYFGDGSGVRNGSCVFSHGRGIRDWTRVKSRGRVRHGSGVRHGGRVRQGSWYYSSACGRHQAAQKDELEKYNIMNTNNHTQVHQQCLLLKNYPY